MKMHRKWIENHFKCGTANVCFIYGKPFGKDVVDVPDDWFVRVNNKSEMSRTGSLMLLTRKGWVENRDAIIAVLNSNRRPNSNFDVVEAIENIIAANEQLMVDEMKKLLLRVKLLGDHLNAMAVYKPSEPAASE